MVIGNGKSSKNWEKIFGLKTIQRLVFFLRSISQFNFFPFPTRVKVNYCIRLLNITSLKNQPLMHVFVSLSHRHVIKCNFSLHFCEDSSFNQAATLQVPKSRDLKLKLWTRSVLTPCVKTIRSAILPSYLSNRMIFRIKIIISYHIFIYSHKSMVNVHAHNLR